jgi:hypothetical protein
VALNVGEAKKMKKVCKHTRQTLIKMANQKPTSLNRKVASVKHTCRDKARSQLYNEARKLKPAGQQISSGDCR